MRKLAVDGLIVLGFVALSLQASHQWRAEYLFQRGESLGREKKWDLALIEYQSAAAIEPDRCEVYRALGYAGLQSYDPGSRNLRPLYQAESAFRASTELVPMSPYGWYDLAEALFRLRQEGATGLPLPEKFFRRALELDPLNPLFLDGLLRWQLGNGRRAEAWETFLALIDSDPAAVGGYGDSLLRSPREVRRLAAAIGTDAEKNLQLARVLYRRNDFELASELLQKLPDQVRLRPELASLLAAVLRRQDRLDQAEVVLTRAWARNPDSLIIARDLGPVLIQQKKSRAAMALYRTVIARNPENWELMLEAANAARQAGEYPLAGKWYQRALDSGTLKERPWLDAILGLAEVQYREGDPRAALASYQKALEFDPGNEEVARRIERLEIEIDRQEH